jgi:hypothetical protein
MRECTDAAIAAIAGATATATATATAATIAMIAMIAIATCEGIWLIARKKSLWMKRRSCF